MVQFPVKIWLRPAPRSSVPPEPFMVRFVPLTALPKMAVPPVLFIKTLPVVVKPAMVCALFPEMVILELPAVKVPVLAKFPPKITGKLAVFKVAPVMVTAPFAAKAEASVVAPKPEMVILLNVAVPPASVTDCAVPLKLTVLEVPGLKVPVLDQLPLTFIVFDPIIVIVPVLVTSPDTVNELVPARVNTPLLVSEAHTAAAPKSRVGCLPLMGVVGIKTMVEEVGIPPCQFESLFQSVLAFPSQVPFARGATVTFRIPVEPVLFRNLVSSVWAAAGEDEPLPQVVPPVWITVLNER